MALPDFLIGGVPKAGTTALHAALAPHPDLYLSRVKEPKFFLSDGRPPAAGGPGDVQTYQEHVWRRSDYEALFAAAPPGTLTGEATPFYLGDLASHDRIARVLPDVRMILLLRDPVDRAHSNWTHLWIAGLESEASFLDACAKEEERIRAGWADFWHYKRLGLYGEQVQHLFERIDRDRVLLLRYRELKDSPVETLDRVCAFLGVRTGLLPGIPKENVNRHVVEDNTLNRVLRGLLRTGGTVGRHFPVPLRLAARGPLLTLLHRHNGTRPGTTPEMREALLPYFSDDIALLEKITGERYDDWLEVERHATRGESPPVM
jgi:hypothetical protein